MYLSKKVFRSNTKPKTQPFINILQEDLAENPDRATGQGAKPAHLRLGKTQEKIENMRNEALKDGYHRGYTDGALAGRKDGTKEAYEEMIGACTKTAADFGEEIDQLSGRVLAAMERWRVEAEESITDLAILIAERALAGELETTRDSVLAITREALREVTFGARATIKVNPFDLPTLREHESLLMAIAPSLKNLELVSDELIAGGCIIETDGGAVDATIKTKLRLLLEEHQEAA